MTNNSTEKDYSATRGTIQLLFRVLLPVAWVGVICWLSLTASPPEMPGFWGWDKLQHAGAYGLLALLVAQSLVIYFNNSKTYFLTSVICIFYGVLIEVLQLIGDAGRTAEWSDVFADIIGVFVGCVIFRHIRLAVLRHDNVRGRTDG